MLKYASVDPCFIDTDFIGEIYTQGDEACEEIIDAENAFYVYQANLDYYYQIEKTFEISDDDNPYLDSDKYPRKYTPLPATVKANDLYFNYSCSSDEILDKIVPVGSGGGFSFTNFIFTSGGVAGLFLQPCLAIFFKSLFSVAFYPSFLCCKGPLKPCCPYAPYANRVLVPIPRDKTDDEEFEPTIDAELEDAIGKFLCVSNILPLILSGIIVFIVALNVAGVEFGDWDGLGDAVESVFLGDDPDTTYQDSDTTY